ncbi:mandelate racemase/muconate lactonizing enzyme family protein [Acuticoccus kandeliae]|uniref:mandelate racemase/muconate lactonizing enzyme family protein n=1 Tax=Acuticoccus kandeliae TaxID=2073160 RepID=UPI000D3E02A6|nr:mandelate racemase/muconate lactonizing enzyme family protein [Acuticoccus kandeliae]
MSAVRSVTVRVAERTMEGTLWNPRTRWITKPIILAFIEDEAGRIGVGEAWVYDGGVTAIAAIIREDMAPAIVGRSPFETRRLTERMFRAAEMSGRGGATAAAWSALDTALWDLAARQVGLPLCDLLGRAHDDLAVYASGGLYGDGKGPGDLAKEVAGWIGDGFGGAKIKVGGAPLAQDVARVAAVREAIGAGPRLMVDALYNLDVAEAIAMARAFAPYDIAFFEAPVSPYDTAGQARVAAASPIPLCGNEVGAWAPAFRELIRADAIHFVQFNVGACGGITEAKRIGELAHVFHRPVTLQASSTAVTYAASLHLAASLPNAHSVEHHMVHQWLADLVPPGVLTPVKGRLAPPPGPGLGLDLNPDDI